jgi:hypothetical protein
VSRNLNSTIGVLFFLPMLLTLSGLTNADSTSERELHPVLHYPLDLIDPAQRGQATPPKLIIRKGQASTDAMGIISAGGVAYDLKNGEVRFDLADYIFCMDFSSESSPLNIKLGNAGGFQIVNVPVNSPLAYESGSLNRLSTTVADTTQCFVRQGTGDQTEMVLLGDLPPSACTATDPDCDRVFSTRFDEPPVDRRSLAVSINAPSQGRVGQLLSYTIEITNTSDLPIDQLGFQELFTPSNPNYATAYWNPDDTIRSCSPSAYCGDVRNETFHFRGTNMNLPAGATITIGATREIWGGSGNLPASQPGEYIELLAGAVAGDHAGRFPPAHASDVARIQVVSDGTFIYAERLDADTTRPVTDEIDEGFNIRVHAQDSDDGGSIPLEGLTIEFVDVCEVIDSSACDPVTDPGFAISPSSSLTNENGYANFHVINTRPGRYELSFAAPDGSLQGINFVDASDGVATVEVEFSPGAGDRLVFVNQPGNVIANEAFGIDVEIRDRFDNLLTADNSTAIVLELEQGPSGAELGGTLLALASGGVASFTDLTVDQVGGSYQLRADTLDQYYAIGDIAFTSGSHTQQIEVPAAATGLIKHLIFAGSFVDVSDATPDQTRLVVTPPAGVDYSFEVSGAGWGFAPGCTTSCISGILDAFPSGTPDEGTWTFVFSHTDPSAGAIFWTAPLITLIAEELTGVSASFSADFGDPAQLVFVGQPANGMVGETLNSVSIEIRDSADNLVANAGNQVNLSLIGGNGSLNGTTTVPATEGVATFSDLSIDQADSGYQLVANASDMAPDASSAFDIAPTSSTTEITSIDPAGSQTVFEDFTVFVEVTGFNPTGTVVVSVSSGESCNIELPDTNCSLFASEASPSTTISASYPGDDNNIGSDDQFSYNITKVAPELTITAIDPPNEQLVGESYQVTVLLSDGHKTTDSTIDVDDGTGGSCSITLPDTSCSMTSTTTGIKTITANYYGDDFNESASDTIGYEILEPLALEIADGAPAGLPLDSGYAYFTTTLTNRGDDLTGVAIWIEAELDQAPTSRATGDPEIQYFNGDSWTTLGWGGDGSYWYNFGREAWFIGRPENPEGDPPVAIPGFNLASGDLVVPMRVNFPDGSYILDITVESVEWSEENPYDWEEATIHGAFNPTIEVVLVD